EPPTPTLRSSCSASLANPPPVSPVCAQDYTQSTLAVLEALSNTDAPPFDRETPVGEELDGFGIDAVLLHQDAGSQGLRRIVFLDRYGRLADDRPCVHPFSHEVDRAPRHFDTPVECLLQGLQ